MTTHHRILNGTYHDSVKLMRVAEDVSESHAVEEAEAVMGTPANRQSLVESGRLPASALTDVGSEDLVLVATAADGTVAERAVEEMVETLAATERSDTPEQGADRPQSIRHAATDDAALALISVPGEYAAREAWKALHEGLHVHLFSDGVSLADERELKTYARKHDQLLMGPDCGTAILDGVPLGFANEVPDGTVGLISASGTGLQAVASRIARRGGGISQAVGTGGRDLSEGINGRTTRTALTILDDDPETEVIVLVSKPPAPSAVETVGEAVAQCSTPVVTHFQGVETAPEWGEPSATLAEAADTALAVADIEPGPEPKSVDRQRFDAAVGELGPERQWVRGLFTGGTLCAEAALTLQDYVGTLRSNVGVGEAVDDPLSPDGHAVVDLGTDELTARRPHPMIEPGRRTGCLADALGDPTVGVVVLDIVLGYGAHSDPAGPVASVVGDAGADTVVIASVCGTDADPQERAAQVETLESVGIYVTADTASAAELAGVAAGRLDGERGRTA